MDKKLQKLCEDFIKKQKISCPETIYQTDGVIENAYEFIENICDIVGYYDDDLEKVVKPNEGNK